MLTAVAACCSTCILQIPVVNLDLERFTFFYFSHNWWETKMTSVTRRPPSVCSVSSGTRGQHGHHSEVWWHLYRGGCERGGGGAVPRVLWDCSGCVCRGLSGQIFLGCAWSGREGLPVIKPVEPKDSRQWLSHSIPIPPSLSNRTDWSVLQYCVTYLRVRDLSKVCLVPVSPYRKSEIHQSDRRPAFWSRSLKARNRDKKMSNFSVINCLFCFVIGTWLWLPLYQNKSRQRQRSPGGYQQ